MSALSRIQAAGFSVALIGDSLEITPASLFTQPQREFLKSHKSEIITELSTYQKIINWLHSIGEDDQMIVNETIYRCKADKDTLSYFLQRAEA
jgi:hypothetical protein